jgi:hypothetical protein
VSDENQGASGSFFEQPDFPFIMRKGYAAVKARAIAFCETVLV